MINTYPFKLFFSVIFLVAVFVQINCAVVFEEPEYEFDDPKCPDEGLLLYKDCYGPLDTCSTCLQKAGRTCSLQRTDRSINCNDCTSIAGGNCESKGRMCFGTQECNNPKYKCVNFTCVYDP